MDVSRDPCGWCGCPLQPFGDPVYGGTVFGWGSHECEAATVLMAATVSRARLLLSGEQLVMPLPSGATEASWVGMLRTFLERALQGEVPEVFHGSAVGPEQVVYVYATCEVGQVGMLQDMVSALATGSVGSS